MRRPEADGSAASRLRPRRKGKRRQEPRRATTQTGETSELPSWIFGCPGQRLTRPGRGATRAILWAAPKLPNVSPPPQRAGRGASMPYRFLGHLEAVLIAAVFLIGPLGSAIKHPSIAAPAAAATVKPAPPQPGASVDGAKIANADADPGEWLSHGRTYSEQRFSPLAKINTSNVNKLGVAWEYLTYSVRGLEATPLVADGVMFITLAWSKVIALNAATGKELWQFDPQVPGETGRYLRSEE